MRVFCELAILWKFLQRLCFQQSFSIYNHYYLHEIIHLFHSRAEEWNNINANRQLAWLCSCFVLTFLRMYAFFLYRCDKEALAKSMNSVVQQRFLFAKFKLENVNGSCIFCAGTESWIICAISSLMSNKHVESIVCTLWNGLSSDVKMQYSPN